MFIVRGGRESKPILVSRRDLEKTLLGEGWGTEKDDYDFHRKRKRQHEEIEECVGSTESSDCL